MKPRIQTAVKRKMSVVALTHNRQKHVDCYVSLNSVAEWLGSSSVCSTSGTETWKLGKFRDWSGRLSEEEIGNRYSSLQPGPQMTEIYN